MEKTVFTNIYTFKLFGIKIFEFKSDYVGYEFKQNIISDKITAIDYLILEEFRKKEKQKKNKFWWQKKN